EIGKSVCRGHELNRRAEPDQLLMKRVPLIHRSPVGALVACPALRVHPRIDRVADRKMLGPAHQEARPISSSVIHRPSPFPVHAALRCVASTSASTSSNRSIAQSSVSRSI